MGKAAITEFIDGSPKGTKATFINQPICLVFEVPRSNLSYVNQEPKLAEPAFYILLGEDNKTKPQAYIGQTENFRERVRDHNAKKDFWQKALVFVSRFGGDLSKSDVQYLECKAIEEAKNANKFALNNNKQKPKEPCLSNLQKEAIDKFFEEVKFLTSSIGCNIFEASEARNKRLFYAKGANYDAKGYYDEDGFTIQKGSVIAKKTSSSYGWEKKREALLEEHAAEEKGVLVLTSDIVFSSPSAAASFCMGSSQNGWKVWKDENDKTLDFVYSQSK